MASDLDNELFARLKAKRLEIAKEKLIAPYMIFHDKTLIGLVSARPKSLEEMLQVSGVGEEKLKKYGAIFLRVLQEAVS